MTNEPCEKCTEWETGFSEVYVIDIKKHFKELHAEIERLESKLKESKREIEESYKRGCVNGYEEGYRQAQSEYEEYGSID
jgi:flagellar biosynthesis/type III secretory pathway protein FliH